MLKFLFTMLDTLARAWYYSKVQREKVRVMRELEKANTAHTRSSKVERKRGAQGSKDAP